ncbi:flagellar biosynthesis protein FlaG [Brevundimonas sp.]|uniref:flagellar biosynthesis protein FlaG n=1 Tax=Brevundimonas sp. TaxID=1871086 RepID=UPI002FC5DF64
MQPNAKIDAVTASAILPAAAGSATGGDFHDSRASQDAERAARYRLVIEEGPSGLFIYKTMDRVTGEVVKQLPREQVVDLMQTGEYSSGSVINTTA